MSDKIRCPRCGRKQPRCPEPHVYYCDRCKMGFDDDPDEGGDYSGRNPAARLERQETLARRR